MQHIEKYTKLCETLFNNNIIMHMVFQYYNNKKNMPLPEILTYIYNNVRKKTFKTLRYEKIRHFHMLYNKIEFNNFESNNFEKICRMHYENFVDFAYTNGLIIDDEVYFLTDIRYYPDEDGFPQILSFEYDSNESIYDKFKYSSINVLALNFDEFAKQRIGFTSIDKLIITDSSPDIDYRDIIFDCVPNVIELHLKDVKTFKFGKIQANEKMVRELYIKIYCDSIAADLIMDIPTNITVITTKIEKDIVLKNICDFAITVPHKLKHKIILSKNDIDDKTNILFQNVVDINNIYENLILQDDTHIGNIIFNMVRGENTSIKINPQNLHININQVRIHFMLNNRYYSIMLSYKTKYISVGAIQGNYNIDHMFEYINDMYNIDYEMMLGEDFTHVNQYYIANSCKELPNYIIQFIKDPYNIKSLSLSHACSIYVEWEKYFPNLQSMNITVNNVICVNTVLDVLPKKITNLKMCYTECKCNIDYNKIKNYKYLKKLDLFIEREDDIYNGFKSSAIFISNTIIEFKLILAGPYNRKINMVEAKKLETIKFEQINNANDFKYDEFINKIIVYDRFHYNIKIDDLSPNYNNIVIKYNSDMVKKILITFILSIRKLITRDLNDDMYFFIYSRYLCVFPFSRFVDINS